MGKLTVSVKWAFRDILVNFAFIDLKKIKKFFGSLWANSLLLQLSWQIVILACMEMYAADIFLAHLLG